MTQHITQEQAYALAKQASTAVIDHDLMGNQITDADVMLMGAFGPLVLRCMNAAIQWDRDQRKAELPELPAPDFYATDQTDRFNDVIYREGYDADQLQSYGAACAAHAREVALEEAKREAVKRHSAGEVGAVLISKAIEQLKARK